MRGLGKLSAGVLGGFMVAVTGTMCLALYVPDSERDRMLIAGLAFMPFWLTAVFVAGLSRNGKRAWLWNGAWFLGMGALASMGWLLG